MFRGLLRQGTFSRSLNLVSRRTYAAEASTGVETSLRLQFALPHETLFSDESVTQVNIPARSGKMGILAHHVPTVEQLTPGIVEIVGNARNEKYFISGGLATVQPDNLLCITAVEAFPLDAFSRENAQSLLADAEKDLQNSSDDKVSAKAAIQVEVLKELLSSLK